MRKFVFLLFLGAGLLACKSEKKEESKSDKVVEVKKGSTTIADGNYKVNVEVSKLNWKGFKPTGSHNGTVNIQKGTLKVANGKLISGKFMFDMNSITVLDIPADDKSNAKLVGHLKSPDFFDVENHSSSTFEIWTVEGEKVRGPLTIKGISKPIEFSASLIEVDGGVKLVGETFKIDRTDFGIEYKSTKFFDNLKDKFINDEFEISFELMAEK